jgi:hypothetical protein
MHLAHNGDIGARAVRLDGGPHAGETCSNYEDIVFVHQVYPCQKAREVYHSFSGFTTRFH